jgi:hypothetical protein
MLRMFRRKRFVRSAARAATRSLVETLEARQMLSVTVTDCGNGDYRVEGTSGADTFTVLRRRPHKTRPTA